MLEWDQEKQEFVCFAVEEFWLAGATVNLKVMRTEIQPTGTLECWTCPRRSAVLYSGSNANLCLAV